VCGVPAAVAGGQAHDDLCKQGMDPTTSAYYNSIEAQVAEALPEKWQQWQLLGLQAKAATTTGGCTFQGQLNG